MAEQSIESMPTGDALRRAVVFAGSLHRYKVEVDPYEHCPVMEFRLRETGTPPRCLDCGELVHSYVSGCGGAYSPRCEGCRPKDNMRFIGEPGNLVLQPQPTRWKSAEVTKSPFIIKRMVVPSNVNALPNPAVIAEEPASASAAATAADVAPSVPKSLRERLLARFLGKGAQS
jgi:hypothetical protein